jgi:hypothetical protein
LITTVPHEIGKSFLVLKSNDLFPIIAAGYRHAQRISVDVDVITAKLLGFTSRMADVVRRWANTFALPSSSPAVTQFPPLELAVFTKANAGIRVELEEKGSAPSTIQDWFAKPLRLRLLLIPLTRRLAWPTRSQSRSILRPIGRVRKVPHRPQGRMAHHATDHGMRSVRLFRSHPSQLRQILPPQRPGLNRYLQEGKSRHGAGWKQLKSRPCVQPSFSHFFMKEAFAAPARGLPFLPTAFASQLDEAALVPPASHFFMKEALAAPASGLPDFDTACASQLEAAGLADAEGIDGLAGAAGVAGVAGAVA